MKIMSTACHGPMVPPMVPQADGARGSRRGQPRAQAVALAMPLATFLFAFVFVVVVGETRVHAGDTRLHSCVTRARVLPSESILVSPERAPGGTKVPSGDTSVHFWWHQSALW